VTTKLLLAVSVMVVGALLLGPAIDELRTGDDGAAGRLFVGAIWNLSALLLSTVLSVYKPGRARRPKVAPNG
jgi:hypothetical protein